MSLSISLDLPHFRDYLGQNYAKFFVYFLEELKARKMAFEIFWPLKKHWKWYQKREIHFNAMYSILMKPLENLNFPSTITNYLKGNKLSNKVTKNCEIHSMYYYFTYNWTNIYYLLVISLTGQWIIGMIVILLSLMVSKL